MNITFKWIGGATWILQVNDIKIACDPVLCPEGHIQDYKFFKTERLNNPVYDGSDFKNVNLWLLTHNHEDHIDKYGMQMIEKDSVIISHKGLESLFNKNKYTGLKFLNWGEETEISANDINIKIRAVPAVHAKNILPGIAVGNGNGYLLEITWRVLLFRIYVTGDAVYNKKIVKHIGNANIDLIISNAGSAMAGKSFMSRVIGRITNNISDIKKMNSDLKPEMLIPVHWGTFSHYTEILTPDSFNKSGNIKVLNPGETINLL
jgi:L-ascorbate metabolism protein UlaG (beta-lactamase superfamily)